MALKVIETRKLLNHGKGEDAMSAGLRVIRGPGWGKGQEDGGEGHVGTVVCVKDDGTVQVTWDGGKVSQLNPVGKQLLVLDNATVGVRHNNYTCDECQETNIVGMRWHCSACDDHDLCSLCYFGHRHDSHHAFDRFETPSEEGGKGVRMDPRSKSKKIQVMGIFPGATVIRGGDWEWADQDGGKGSKGKVLDVITPAPNSARSTVKVEWKGNGFKNMYRVGFKGKVDLQYTVASPGGDCFPQHLPIFDPKTYSSSSSASKDAKDGSLSEGDRVVITVSAEELKQLQQSRSGWAVGMVQFIGKTGEVKGFAANGDVIVSFGAKKYRLVPRSLKKVCVVSVGDTVRVVNDSEQVKVLQEGHGGYNSDMKAALNKVGEVIQVDEDGDAVVQFGQQKWLFNPACLSLAPGEAVDSITSGGGGGTITLQRGDSTTTALNQILGALFMQAAQRQASGVPDQQIMLKAVVENDVPTVKRLLEKNKELAQAVESKRRITALHIAANQGKLSIVQLLVENGAKLDEPDGDGDTPIMVSMKHEAVVDYLLKKGCDVKKSNDNGQTAAHKAALHGQHTILRQLATRGADFNAVDESGDTPLHDTIEKNHHTAAEVLISWPKMEYRRKNNKGFSPLHLTAIKDTPTIAELLIKRDKSIVDEQKDDGFTPLLVAAINNHTDVMKVLLEKGNAKVDLRTQKKQTALHVAAEQAYMDVVQILVKHGADVNAKDSDGDRPLHILMMPGNIEQGGDEIRLLLEILGQTSKVKEEERIRIACFLIQAGADPDAVNDEGKTALQLCKNQTISDGVNKFMASNKPQRPKTPALVREATQSAMRLCRKCLTKRAEILFVPCGHKAACKECCIKNKLRTCPQCGNAIKSRYDNDGKELGACIVM